MITRKDVNTLETSPLHKNIKLRRTRLGMTLGDLGDKVGVTRATIHRYESGNIANIDTRMIEQLANALECTPAQLMGWETLPEVGNKKLDELITLCYTLDDEQLQAIINTVNTFRKVWDSM